MNKMDNWNLSSHAPATLPPPASPAALTSNPTTAQPQPTLPRSGALPPPPARLPRGFQPLVFPTAADPAAVDLDLLGPTPPAIRAAEVEDGEFVPETPPELLRRTDARGQAGPATARFIQAGGWPMLRAAINSTPATAGEGSSSLRAGLEGRGRACHRQGDGGVSNPPRRPALHSRGGAFMAGQRPPPPAWLLGRCFHCL
jgi:hypothetical protein